MTIRDGDWSLIDWDPVTGRTVWSYFDGRKTVVRTDYPVEAAIKQNSDQRAVAGSSWKGDWHHTASIPLNVFHDSGMAEAQLQGDDKFVSRWLNDSDNRPWRTKEGTI